MPGGRMVVRLSPSSELLAALVLLFGLIELDDAVGRCGCHAHIMKFVAVMVMRSVAVACCMQAVAVAVARARGRRIFPRQISSSTSP